MFYLTHLGEVYEDKRAIEFKLKHRLIIISNHVLLQALLCFSLVLILITSLCQKRINSTLVFFARLKLSCSECRYM